MSVLRCIVLIAIVFLVAGCATRSSVSDGTRIPPGHGLLVLSIQTEIPSGQLQFKKFASVQTSKDALNEYFLGPDGSLLFKKGTAYWVRPIPAGKYMWSRVDLYPRFALFHGSNTFTIEPGAMTYVGHLSVSDIDGYANVEVRDSEADMVSYLSKNYPTYVSAMQIKKSITHFMR